MAEFYQLESYRERNIAKFNVMGHEYKLSVDFRDRNRTYTDLLIRLHRVLEGGMFVMTHVHVMLKVSY